MNEPRGCSKTSPIRKRQERRHEIAQVSMLWEVCQFPERGPKLPILILYIEKARNQITAAHA